MKLAIRFIDTLFQKANKIINQIAVKIEGVPQVIGDIVNIALYIAAIQVKWCLRHGDGMEKGFGIKIIML